jgi:hypothetical protein
MRPSFHPGDDPYLYVQQLAAWQRLVAPISAVSGDTKETKLGRIAREAGRILPACAHWQCPLHRCRYVT